MTLQFLPLLLQALALMIAVCLPVAVFGLWWQRRFNASKQEVQRIGEAAVHVHRLLYDSFYNPSQRPLNPVELEVLLAHRLPAALERLELSLYGRQTQLRLVRAQQPENLQDASQPEGPRP